MSGDDNIISYARADWLVPKGAEPDANGNNIKRAQLVAGGAGYFTHVIDCPAGYVLPPHSHDHDELIVVLRGTCEVGDAQLQPFDTVAIPANQKYGLIAGEGGVEFMVIRRGEAKLELAK
jgi:quercetin dioxygenase-like cupin family protein